MATPSKETIYVDIDDEITSIIEKIKKSSSNIVALVLPKRAGMLQSIVNMKLLKRSADQVGKRVVLITSETGLLPLAGAVGLYVAKNLQSPPEIPAAPDIPELDEEEVQADVEDTPVDKQKSLAELSGEKPEPKPEPKEAAAVAATPKPKKVKDKKAKEKKVPNFEKFRLKLFLGLAAVIVLLFGWYWASFMAPKLKATITTDSTTAVADVTFTADPDANGADVAQKVVAAKIAEKQDDQEEQASATGTKDVGEKAKGSVSMTAKNCGGISAPSSVPAGTTLKANGMSFTTNSNAAFTFNDISGGCVYFKSDGVGITAAKSGTDSNLSSASFTVSGRADVTAEGSTSGGTSKTVKVVSQQDVDSAKGKLESKDDEIKQQLKQELETEGYLVIEDSFKKDEKFTATPSVGSESDDVTVRVTRKYTMVAVPQDQLHSLIEDAIKDEAQSQNRQLQNDGLDEASFKVDKTNSDGSVVLSVQTTATLGPIIDVEALKTDIAGKKKGDTESIIRGFEGVKEVELDYSPFWVSSTPKKTQKIIIEFKGAEE